MLTQFLPEGAIRIPLETSARENGGKEAVIAELVGLLPPARNVERRTAILDAVMRRECQMSTGIGEGIAIPHGNADIEPLLMVAAGVAPPPGVPFNAIDQEPVRLFFLLVAREGERAAHLQALAHIARIMRCPETRLALLNAPDAATFRRVLAAAE